MTSALYTTTNMAKSMITQKMKDKPYKFGGFDFPCAVQWEVTPCGMGCTGCAGHGTQLCGVYIPTGTISIHFLGKNYGDHWWCQDCIKKYIYNTVPNIESIKGFQQSIENGINIYGWGEQCNIPSVIFKSTTKYTKQKAKKVVKEKCILCHVDLCEICGLCETESCNFIGKAIYDVKQIIQFKYLLSVTQKARGYMALASTGITVPNPYRIILDEEDIDSVIIGLRDKIGSYNMMVRPCPMRPRHGFVESRPFDFTDGDIKDQLTKIFNEAKAADSGAELLVCPKIQSAYNLVITPTRLAIGYGHDGATSGKGSIMVPLVGVPFDRTSSGIDWDKTYRKAGVDTSVDDPYFEAVLQNYTGKVSDVYNSNQAYFTQLRAGIKIPPTVGKDFVPYEIIVDDVIKASGDLLEWEAQTKKIKRGSVVYHIGGTLISHYGIHCLANDVPIITTYKPVIGDVLLPTARPDKPYPKAVMRGLVAGMKLPLTTVKCGNAIKFMMVALHNYAAMGGEEGFWIGAAAAIMIRAGMAASHGEARHADANIKYLRRDQVYSTSFTDFFGSRRTLGHAQWLFLNYKDWGGGYGGKKWAQCTEALIGLDSAALDLIRDPNDLNVANIVTRLNDAVNQAHNGGWWLDKFVEQQYFDMASRQNLVSLVIAAPVFMDLHSLFLDDIDEVLEKWKNEDVVEVKKREGVDVIVRENDDDDDDPDYKDHGQHCGDSWCGGCNAEYGHQDNCACDDCKDDLDDDSDNIKGSKSTFTDTNPNINVAEYVSIPSDAKVVEAQIRQMDKGYGHIQYRLEGITGYFSTNVVIPKDVTIVGTLNSYGKSTVWSYAPLKIINAIDFSFSMLEYGKVELFFKLKPINNACTLIDTDGYLKEQKNEPTKGEQEKEQEENVLPIPFNADDIPF